jgi:cellulose synthase/poly-beta-1,6-N-acetylglucosamine synthase-like glycosyltransferase
MFAFLQTLFWLATGTIGYTFLGYPIAVTILAFFRRHPVAKSPITPQVTLLIPAYNEEKVIASKIENSLQLDFPLDRLQVVVVADGSDDGTVDIAKSYSNVDVYFNPERRGKAAAVNRIMPLVQSDIVVFTDANTVLDRNALLALVRNFADPSVGGVAGEKRVHGGGEGLYWRYESYLKRCDSSIGSVMGASGELFAVRKNAFLPPAEDSIIEDFVLSMEMVGNGWRVVYEPQAVAAEASLGSVEADWQRRTRIAAGGHQAIHRLTHLLNPSRGIVAWQYFSHRVLRWAVTPFLLPTALFLNLLLWPKWLYKGLVVIQLSFYGAGFIGYLRARKGHRRGVINAIFYFCLANMAAIVGFWRYATGRQPVTWKKVRP